MISWEKFVEVNQTGLGSATTAPHRARHRQCPDEGLFTPLDGESNSIAIVVKHVAGNMRSRWTDFLSTDGEKPDRNRDREFEEPPKTRAELLAMWRTGLEEMPLFDALAPLTDADQSRTVLIRTSRIR